MHWEVLVTLSDDFYTMETNVYHTDATVGKRNGEKYPGPK